MIKVYEASSGNHRLISTPTSPFSTKPILTLEENRVVLLVLLLKPPECMVADGCYTISK